MSVYMYKHVVGISCRFTEIIKFRRAMSDEQWIRRMWCK